MLDCNTMPLKKQTIKHKQQLKQNNILKYASCISMLASLSLPLNVFRRSADFEAKRTGSYHISMEGKRRRCQVCNNQGATVSLIFGTSFSIVTYFQDLRSLVILHKKKGASLTYF